MSLADDAPADLARGEDSAPTESGESLGLPTAEDTVGLSLSGGGYRAMLFHLGSLMRLNEAGWLPRVDRVASVSGGSIIAGRLGLVWSQLTFDDNGIATNLEDLVSGPILELAAHTVDAPAVLTGLWPGRISSRVQKAYDKRLFQGATLQDLPAPGDGPLFEVLATNLSNGTLWRFSQPRMGDWRTGYVTRPDLALAHAVAASSAFPPVLSPCVLDVPGRGRVHLTDGGVYDNLGIEPIIKNCGTILVSDGGGTFTEQDEPHSDWLRGTLRVLNVIDVEVRRLRRRQVMGALASYHRDPPGADPRRSRRGGFWAINTDPEHRDFVTRSPGLEISTERARELARTPTRLAGLDERTRHALANWGYAATDLVLRNFVDTSAAAGRGFPYTGGVG